MIEITEQNYEETVRNNDVVILDFYADWCGPCKAMVPVLARVEATAQEQGQSMVVGKVNTGEQVDLSVKFGVSALPTLVFIKDNKEVHRHLGMTSACELSDVIDGFFSDEI